MKRLVGMLGILWMIGTFCSCAVQKQNAYNLQVDQDSILRTAHVGVKVVNLDDNKILFEHNAHHLFVPASNTKLLTTFAAMEIFGDSIPGWYISSDAKTLYVEPNGDPTFLQNEFAEQKMFDLLKNTDKEICIILPEGNFGRFGSGWSWGSWQQTYAQERSTMPVYGNMVRFYKSDDNVISAVPSYFDKDVEQPSSDLLNGFTSILRSEHSNTFAASKNSSRNSWVRPFTAIDNDSLAYVLLKDTLKNIKPDVNIHLMRHRPAGFTFREFHTLPTDTLLSVMMKRSDNFFAEQILLMAGKVKLGKFDDTAIRNYMLEALLNEVWNKGSWVDGSGLSRSNLISPNEFINLLKVMYANGSFERLRAILPHGNEGTLTGYYINHENNISAKTGTLTNHLALSGYLISEKGRNLAFSFLINNHRGSATAFRKKIEEYLTAIIEKY